VPDSDYIRKSQVTKKSELCQHKIFEFFEETCGNSLAFSTCLVAKDATHISGARRFTVRTETVMQASLQKGCCSVSVHLMRRSRRPSVVGSVAAPPP